MGIARFRSGDHINQEMYVKEDLRVVDDGIMLILELKPENQYRRVHFFFLVFVRYGIVS